MIINNDKNNELTQTIASIAQNQIKKGKVEAIYLNAFIPYEGKAPNINVTSVVKEVSEGWSDAFYGRYSD